MTLPNSPPLYSAPPTVASLSRLLAEEITAAAGFSATGLANRAVQALFGSPLRKFAALAVGFDQEAAAADFPAAARWFLPQFVSAVEVDGVETIPRADPLLIVANHPGVYDFLVISAHIPRQDLHIVASALPFFRALPATSRCLLYTARDAPHQRMTVVRQAIRRLQSGCALLLFPAGTIEPDPACLPGAAEGIEKWYTSLEIILRKVPQTQVIIALVSRIFSPEFLRHPFTHLRKSIRDRQRLAEILQVIHQVRFPRRLLIHPRLTFYPLEPGQADMPTLLAQVRKQLDRHLA